MRSPLVLLLLLAGPAGLTAAEARKNVLLIVSDDCRAAMGAYGGPGITPHLDDLARSGMRFDRAYCQYALCNPSRTSFLTGLRPDTTKVNDNAGKFRKTVPDAVTLPQMFRNGGYAVARIGKLYHYGVPREIGTDGADDPASWEQRWNPRGRDCDDEDRIFSIGVPAGSGPRRGRPTEVKAGSRDYGATLSWLAAEGTDAEQTDGKIAAQAIEFLRQGRDRPFFLAVGFFRPHTPFVAPRAYFDLYPRARLALAPEMPGDRASKPPVALSNTPVAHYGMDEETQRIAKQAYLASMSFMDAQVGLMLAELRRLGLDRNTVVVFISDHGYNLGEHGLWQKRSLYEDSVRVPMLLRDPGVTAPGSSTGRVVELLDLYPTLADLCGLQPDRRVEGRSLRPLLADPKAAWDHGAFSQVLVPTARDKDGTPNRKVGRTVRTERHRYVEWNEGALGAELYDHERDPGEFTNLAKDPAHAGVVAELRARLARAGR